jgi:hypothetical protein
MAAIESGGITYLASGLNRLTGFIGGLEAGAEVTLAGSALPVPHNDTVKILRVEKMTFDGKDYDFGLLRKNLQGAHERIRPNAHARPAPRPEWNHGPRAPRPYPNHQKMQHYKR